MTGRLLITLTLVLGLSACSSQLNPLNWFSGGSDDGIVLEPEGGFPSDNDSREIIAQITDLKVLRASGGAIIQVTGVPPRQGYWNAELVPENNENPENGVLTYVFHISEPARPTATGNPYARTVYVAHFISDIRLEGVRQIRVLGEQNSRISRR